MVNLHPPVGHTGSGKSTFALALLRRMHTEVEVYIDGVPTSTLNLSALRSSISIIPQAGSIGWWAFICTLLIHASSLNYWLVPCGRTSIFSGNTTIWN